MANTVSLEFAGDAQKLQGEARKADQAVLGVGDAATRASDDMAAAGTEAGRFEQRIGSLGAGVTGMTDAVDSAGAAVQGLADLQQAGANQAMKLARAANDVEQAQEDAAQATRDAAQATLDLEQSAIDAEQAQIDEAQAMKDYNEAVKEHGAGSIEARQAKNDLAQASLDFLQAEEDAAQATRDASQAAIDGKAATLDLAEAQREANPPDLQKWADQIGLITPLLTGLVGVVGLVTAAQWAWNVAQYANPTVWIVAAILAVIAVIVLIATKTDWFQKLWRNSWKWITTALSQSWATIKKVGGYIGDFFTGLGRGISGTFKASFNGIASAWNNTVGRLSWTVPGWVPFIGGNTLAVPKIPKFHSGGVVPGAPGSEMLAVLQAGETVTPAGKQAAPLVIRSSGTELDDLLVELLSRAARRSGGDVQVVYGGRNA
jgi:hypothetical protein